MAFARTEADAFAVQEQSISRISRNVEEHILSGRLFDSKCLAEQDELSLFGCIIVIRRPYPFGLTIGEGRICGHDACLLGIGSEQLYVEVCLNRATMLLSA